MPPTNHLMRTKFSKCSISKVSLLKSGSVGISDYSPLNTLLFVTLSHSRAQKSKLNH
jgi:hypothetical protein